MMYFCFNWIIDGLICVLEAETSGQNEQEVYCVFRVAFWSFLCFHESIKSVFTSPNKLQEAFQ